MNVESIGRVINSGDFRMQSWLLESDLSAGAKLTYTVLASLAGGKDHAWPSQSYLADKVSVSIRTVQCYLRELVESGLIEKCRAFLKGRVRCFYKFLAAGSTSSTAPRTVADQSDNMLSCSEIIAYSPASEASNCRAEGDNLSSSLNKVDTIKGNENLPPAPLQDQPSEPSAKSRVRWHNWIEVAFKGFFPGGIALIGPVHQNITKLYMPIPFDFFHQLSSFRPVPGIARSQ